MRKLDYLQSIKRDIDDEEHGLELCRHNGLENENAFVNLLVLFVSRKASVAFWRGNMLYIVTRSDPEHETELFLFSQRRHVTNIIHGRSKASCYHLQLHVLKN